MALFRFHRGSLADSLQTTIIVKSKDELLQKINEHYPEEEIEGLKIEPYGSNGCFDSRCGWDTQIVTNKNGIGVFGFL